MRGGEDCASAQLFRVPVSGPPLLLSPALVLGFEEVFR